MHAQTGADGSLSPHPAHVPEQDDRIVAAHAERLIDGLRLRRCIEHADIAARTQGTRPVEGQPPVSCPLTDARANAETPARRELSYSLPPA